MRQAIQFSKKSIKKIIRHHVVSYIYLVLNINSVLRWN